MTDMCQLCFGSGLVYNKKPTLIGKINRQHLSKYDPTNTFPIIEKFDKEIAKRFRQLSRVIARSILTDQVFGDKLKINALKSPGKNAFAFTQSQKAIDGFMNWLKRMVSESILGIRFGTKQPSSRDDWSRIYIESAYRSGMRQAADRLKAAGADVKESWFEKAFWRPIHADRVAKIYGRAFEDLKDITAEMADQIRETLSLGMAFGWGARKLVDEMINRVDKIGVTRSRTLARTEIIAAHADSTLTTYDEANVLGVDVEAEWTATDDNAVCEICSAMQGTTYTISEARGLIPAHPNCRCAFLPKIADVSNIYLG